MGEQAHRDYSEWLVFFESHIKFVDNNTLGQIMKDLVQEITDRKVQQVIGEDNE